MGDSDKGSERLSSLRKTMRRLSGQLPKGDSSHNKGLSEYESEIEELQTQVKILEEEAFQLRRRLEQAPREFEFLRLKLSQSREQLDTAQQRNERLVAALQSAKDQIQALKEEVDKLTAPPSSYGIYSTANEDGTINIYTGGRKLRVNLHPSLNPKDLRRGQELLLNEAMNVVEACSFEVQGLVVQLKELLWEDRAIVSLHADEERVAELAEPLRLEKLSIGDKLLYDPRSGYLLEKLPKAEIEDLILEEVPQISYDDIGGLDQQIEMIRDAIELPYLYSDYFREHKLQAPKGVLLYGPPGCGKTLIAKAVANSLAKQMAERTGRDAKGYFLNVKGPELLNKYVGETERKIREVFQRAKEKAEEGMPVVIFFDEMDSLFRIRGSGISSDVESTIVPQFLAEIDGVEGLRNVIVIGASNRQDLIDPAVLRPGRFDVKIKIDRPNKEAAKDIFSKYLTPDLPFAEEEITAYNGDKKAIVRSFISLAAEEMYATSDENRFLEVTYQSGEREVLYFRDFVSGAMIESIVTRAKKHAVKRLIRTGEKGIRADDLLTAVKEEFKENEDLPNTQSPDDWAKIAGRKSERIVHVQGIFDRTGKKPPKIESISPGHYL
ncbi:MAG: proteasome ATPase [candidate division NC10 bacterium]|nr:proteasome ATPase [candidate division NC10 bacterium]